MHVNVKRLWNLSKCRVRFSKIVPLLDFVKTLKCILSSSHHLVPYTVTPFSQNVIIFSKFFYCDVRKANRLGRSRPRLIFSYPSEPRFQYELFTYSPIHLLLDMSVWCVKVSLKKNSAFLVKTAIICVRFYNKLLYDVYAVYLTHGTCTHD